MLQGTAKVYFNIVGSLNWVEIKKSKNKNKSKEIGFKKIRNLNKVAKTFLEKVLAKRLK